MVPLMVIGHVTPPASSPPNPLDEPLPLRAEGTRPGATTPRARVVYKRGPELAKLFGQSIAEAIEAEREAAAAQFDTLPAGMSLTPTEVAAILRARPRP